MCDEVQKISEYEVHPAAAAYQMLDEHDLGLLIDDIKAHGLRQKIVIYNGRILDGRNRLAACIKAGVEPEFIDFLGDEADAIAYVASVNSVRRHLNDWQRAGAVQRLGAMMSRLAKKERKARAQPKLPGVNEATAEMIEAIQEGGSPELVAAVERGDIHVAHGAKIAEHPPEVQAGIVKTIEAEIHNPDAVTRSPAPSPPVCSRSVEVTAVEVESLRRAVALLSRHVMPEMRAAAEAIKRIVPEAT